MRPEKGTKTMTEYVNKEELDRLFGRYGLSPEHRCKAFNQVFPSFAMDKEILSTIDIVRCKDCKYYNKSIRLCDIGHSACAPNWFCADMRRSENND